MGAVEFLRIRKRSCLFIGQLIAGFIEVLDQDEVAVVLGHMHQFDKILDLAPVFLVEKQADDMDFLSFPFR